MKTTFPILLLAALLSCHPRWQQKSSDAYLQLPKLSMLLTDSATVINTANLPEDHPLLFVYFSPDCEHCQAATAYLLQHISQLQSATIFFVSNASVTEIRQFATTFHLSRYKNIVVANDYKYDVFNVFQIRSYPYLIIYNQHKSLVRLYKELTSIRHITAALQSNG